LEVGALGSRNAAKSVALITALSFGLATGALAGSKGNLKRFSGGVYSPAKGIICDRNAGF
jgi:hypothetical protein